MIDGHVRKKYSDPYLVYQPSFTEYSSYLASIYSNFNLSEKGHDTIKLWFENARKVLS